MGLLEHLLAGFLLPGVRFGGWILHAQTAVLVLSVGMALLVQRRRVPALMAVMEGGLAAHGVRVRRPDGQIDPIWVFIMVGGALVLAYAFYKYVLPGLMTLITGSQTQINNTNTQINSCYNDPATCSVGGTTGGG